RWCRGPIILRTIGVDPFVSISHRGRTRIVDAVPWSTRPVRITLTLSVGIGLSSSVVVRPKTPVGVRLSVAASLNVSRSGHRGDSHVVANFGPLRLNLMDLRDSQRPASIGPNSLLLPGEGRWWRRRSVLHNDDAIFHHNRRSNPHGHAATENSFSRRSEGGCSVSNAGGNHFALVHNDRVP